MKLLIITGLSLMTTLTAFSQSADSIQYSPNKSVITCHDMQTGNRYRFQFGGNWMEIKSNSASEYSTCTSSIEVDNEDTVVVQSNSDYELKKISDFKYSSSNNLRIGKVRYDHECQETGNKDFSFLTSGAEQIETVASWALARSNEETLIIPSSNSGSPRILRFGQDSSTDKIPADVKCTNLDAPRFKPKVSAWRN
jgi:hypothetical protein